MSTLKEAALQIYDVHRNKLRAMVQGKEHLSFPATRTLEGPLSYVEYLPTFRRRDNEGNILTEPPQTFITVIDQLILDRESEAQKTGKYRKPVVVDIGYGVGQALLDAYAKWGDKITLVGFGPDELTDFVGMDEGLRREVRTATRENLTNAGIRVITGSAIEIADLLPPELHPDVLLSCNALQYTAFPLWEQIKSLYEDILQPDGYAFIAVAPPQSLRVEHVLIDTSEERAIFNLIQGMHARYKKDLAYLATYLQSQGYYFDTDSDKGYIAFQKLAGEHAQLPPTSDIHTVQDFTLQDIDLYMNTDIAGVRNAIAYVQNDIRGLSLHPVTYIKGQEVG